MLTFTGQIPCGCKPLCQQTLTQPFSWDNGEELTRNNPEFKATENKIYLLPNFLSLRKLMFLCRLKTFYNKQ